MKHEFVHKSSFVILFLVFLFIDSAAVFSQQINKSSEPLVFLTAFASPQGDTVASTLASTMTSSIALMLKLTGRVTLRRADYLNPTTSLKRTVPYYEEHKAAEAVYGSIAPTGNGEYVIDIELWNASDPNSKPTMLRRTISNVLSSFKLADKMSLRVASTVVGKKLEEGTLVLQNVDSLPQFAVYANGHLLGRNRTSFHILTGSWKIVVAKPGEVGDVPVQTYHVDIQQGETAIVALSQAPTNQTAVVNQTQAPPGANPTLSKGIDESSTNGPNPVLQVSHATGSIAITTTSAGTLYLDGRMMGHIPAGGATLSSVKLGTRYLSMHYADGHVERKDITVQAGNTSDVSFSHRVILASRWTEHTLPSNQYWQSVTFGKGTFVAVAVNGKVDATSPDGVRWVEHLMPSSDGWISVAYGNGTFVAMAEGSDVVATSTDGVNWTKHIPPIKSQQWVSIAYGHGTFVAVGFIPGGGANPTEAVATSPDGIYWTEHTMPSAQVWMSVAYGNGTFVAMGWGTANVVATSSDGVNWTQHKTMVSIQGWQSVTYGNGIFVAVPQRGDLVATSPDGVNWTKHTMPSSQQWGAVAYGHGTFVAVAQGSHVVETSTDGVNWTEHNMPGRQNWSSVAFGNDTFVAVGAGSGYRTNDVAATSP